MDEERRYRPGRARVLPWQYGMQADDGHPGQESGEATREAPVSHRLNPSPSGMWERLRAAGFWAVMFMLMGLIGLIVGLSIGLRWF
jgi:hypothetical protein